MSEKNNKEDLNQEEVQYSLNDDRRVKVLSPGALVAKRFFRNRIAVVGLTILAVMFIFSFIGGLISPYGEKQFFYRYEGMVTEVGGAKENKDFRYTAKDPELFDTITQANTSLAIVNKKDSFENDKKVYTVTPEGEELYSVSLDGEIIGIAAKPICYFDSAEKDFDLIFNCLKAYAASDAVPEEGAPETASDSFELNGSTYVVEKDGGIKKDGEEIGYVSTYIVSSINAGTNFSRDFKEAIQYFIESNDEAGNFVRDGENEKLEFVWKDPSTGEEQSYVFAYNAADSRWVIKQDNQTYIYDTYSAPSEEHALGTDSNGMDMLTRLMYGGRVSLIIGFIVVMLETSLGIIMGGIAGYFGGWIDNLIMRLVDIFYCIPSTPILIIIGAAMDKERVDPTLRMIYLMLILGVLGWAGVARLVRGQILSLREQEFMTATEACGIKVSSRIFRHLIPNVIPQLIVNCTMGLGSVIIMEATLSFLGLGVRFPFASWGNIISDVNNTFVLTSYWFIWIPAGVLLLLTVLAFNIVGDGLRDAFDPRMKR